MNARADIEALLGLHHGMSIERYHAAPGLSCSGMCDLARSPQHYHALHVDPARPPRAEKPGQLEGNLAHCAILEMPQYPRRYAVGPDCRRGTKAWDAWAAGETRTPIKAEQHAAAMAQARSVIGLPDVAQLLAAGQPEVSAFWIDEQTGVLCRCRPDFVHTIDERRVILCDVKTCAEADAKGFARQVARKNYARQAAFYSTGFAQASGLEVAAFIFIAVECSPPFAAGAHMLTEEWITAAEQDNRRLLNLYAQCMQSGNWPGYGDSVNILEMPQWLAKEPE